MYSFLKTGFVPQAYSI